MAGLIVKRVERVQCDIDGDGVRANLENVAHHLPKCKQTEKAMINFFGMEGKRKGPGGTQAPHPVQGKPCKFAGVKRMQRERMHVLRGQARSPWRLTLATAAAPILIAHASLVTATNSKYQYIRDLNTTQWVFVPSPSLKAATSRSSRSPLSTVS